MKICVASVNDKRGIGKFAKFLSENGWEIFSTTGTKSLISSKGIKCRDIMELTGRGEMLSGKVKTLHPNIHAGILAGKDEEEYLEKMGIRKIHMVISNFYTPGKLAEGTDIGGPAMIRAAAKNWKNCIPVSSPNQYDRITEELGKRGEVSEETRKELAVMAFEETMTYDSKVIRTFDKDSHMAVVLKRKMKLRYGENKHQKATLYGVEGEREVFKRLHGPELSYNNILDLHSAVCAVMEFEQPAGVVIKHNSPCGASENKDVSNALENAISGDPKAAFGGIIAVNREFGNECAEAISNMFIEAVAAPEFSQEALDMIKRKRRVRAIKFNKKNIGKSTYSRETIFGTLIQETDNKLFEKLEVVTERKPSEKEMDDAVFAMKVCKHAISNAVVLAKNKTAIGVGAGQMKRIDAGKIAYMVCEENGREANGSVMASDGFIPFRDLVDFAAGKGVSVIIQPGGSIRDRETISAAEEYGISMVFTGIRHFKH